MHQHHFEMLDYSLWANLRVAHFISTHSCPAEAESLFAHIIGAEQRWLSRIKRTEDKTGIWPILADLNTSDLLKSFNSYAKEIISTCSNLDDVFIDYKTSDGKAYTSSLNQIFIQLSHHGAYHRGQIAKIAKEAGLQPIPTDYILYCREIKNPLNSNT